MIVLIVSGCEQQPAFWRSHYQKLVKIKLINTNAALRSRHSLFGWMQDGISHESTEDSAWRTIMRSYTEQNYGLSPTPTLGCDQEQHLKMLAKPDPIKYSGSNQSFIIT